MKILLALCIFVAYWSIGLLIVRLLMWPLVGDAKSYDSLYTGLSKIPMMGGIIRSLDPGYTDRGKNIRYVIRYVEAVWTFVWPIMVIFGIAGFIAGVRTRNKK